MGRNYARKEEPTLSDLVFIYDTAASDWKLTTVQAVLALSTASTTGLQEPTTQYSAPSATGFSVTVGTGLADPSVDTHLILQPASAFATGTIVLPLPANIREKQKIIVSCTQQVSTLTVDGNGVSGVYGAPTSLGADDFFTLKYDSTLDSWFRVG